MRLDVYIENRHYPIEVSPETLAGGLPFFDKMDRDMDAGWRMGPEFVEHPDRLARGQIAASRLLLAIESGNQAMVDAMAGYIAARLPQVRRVLIDTNGEPLNTQMLTADGERVV